MTHRLSKTVLDFSSAVGCLCLALVLWGRERRRKGHLSPQKCLAATCSWPEVSHFQLPFPPQCAWTWVEQTLVFLSIFSLLAAISNELAVLLIFLNRWLAACQGAAECVQLALQNVAGRILSVATEGTEPCKLPSAVEHPRNAVERALGSTSTLKTSTPPFCYLCKGTSLKTWVCYLLARLIFTLCQKDA